jgi:hypothetical protein
MNLSELLAEGKIKKIGPDSKQAQECLVFADEFPFSGQPSGFVALI